MATIGLIEENQSFSITFCTFSVKTKLVTMAKVTIRVAIIFATADVKFDQICKEQKGKNFTSS